MKIVITWLWQLNFMKGRSMPKNAKKIIKICLFLLYWFAFPNVGFSAHNTCVAGDCENGEGVMDYALGYYYVGGFKNNSRDGEGITKYSGPGKSIQIYENAGCKTSGHILVKVMSGMWKNDGLNGKGSVVFNDNTEYVGDFEDNLFHGYGILTCSNGDNYMGQFKNGRFDGEGQLFRHGADQIDNGTFKKGRLVIKKPFQY